MAQYCASINPCKVGIVEGDLADQSGRDENSGMRGVVAMHANIQIVGAQPTNYDPEKALNVATNLLTAHPDLNYIYSWWIRAPSRRCRRPRARDWRARSAPRALAAIA